jgi:6-phosphogluconolactonase/glucosamine-6-phosphate isomerase/deaminase
LEVVVLASGEAKAAAVARALAPKGSEDETPARLVRERTWLLDRAAAAEVSAAR